jgi:hypothetical protein
MTALATVHRDVRGCSAEVGNRVRVSSISEHPFIRGPLSHVWVSICLLVFFLLFFLFRIFIDVFVSAPASASMCSLSLSHTTTSRALCISLYSLRVPPRMSLQ